MKPASRPVCPICHSKPCKLIVWKGKARTKGGKPRVEHILRETCGAKVCVRRARAQAALAR